MHNYVSTRNRNKIENLLKTNQRRNKLLKQLRFSISGERRAGLTKLSSVVAAASVPGISQRSILERSGFVTKLRLIVRLSLRPGELQSGGDGASVRRRRKGKRWRAPESPHITLTLKRPE